MRSTANLSSSSNTGYSEKPHKISERNGLEKARRTIYATDLIADVDPKVELHLEP